MIGMLLAMQQADAAFPSGGFAFSNGIEGVAALPAGLDRAALARHAAIAVRHRWATMDRVALAHAWRADGDLARLAAVDAAIDAATVVESLRTGSRRAGRALLTSHVRLATPHAETLSRAVAAATLHGHLATLQGCLWRALGLAEAEATAVSGYQAVASLASAAVRLGRVGALEAQTVIRDLLPEIAAFAECPVATPGTEIALSSFTPYLDIATMRGAEAELRLFAN